MLLCDVSFSTERLYYLILFILNRTFDPALINNLITVIHIYFLIAGFHEMKVAIFELYTLQQSKMLHVFIPAFFKRVGFLLAAIHFLIPITTDM